MNDASFKQLYDTYKKHIYGYVWTLTRSSYAAEEITQDIFVKLWLCRDTLGGIEKIDSYIFSMAHNKTLNFLRKSSNEDRLIRHRVEPGLLFEQNATEERLLVSDYRQIIGEALQTLTPQRKLVYHLSRHAGMKQQEIAEYLQLSPHTVKNHLVEALRTIRQYLRRYRGSGVLIPYFALLQHFFLFF